VELVDHALGAEGGIHLANATFLHQHITVVEKRFELIQLLVHRYNDTYLHVFLLILSAKIIIFE
jgi:hypothetical protein